MMFKYLAFLAVAAVVLYLLLRPQLKNFDPKKRKKIYVYGICFFSFLTFILIGFQSRSEQRVKNSLIAAGFVAESNNSYSKDYRTYRLNLTYVVQASPRPDIKNYFSIEIESQVEGFNLRSLFCSQKEMAEFGTSNLGWFPTSETQLVNKHYVGNCYPGSVKESIKALPVKKHDFKMRTIKNLFIPKGDTIQQSINIYTENTDLDSLVPRIDDFLNYYDLIVTN